jgi:hypothetical protein
MRGRWFDDDEYDDGIVIQYKRIHGICLGCILIVICSGYRSDDVDGVLILFINIHAKRFESLARVVGFAWTCVPSIDEMKEKCIELYGYRSKRMRRESEEH